MVPLLVRYPPCGLFLFPFVLLRQGFSVLVVLSIPAVSMGLVFGSGLLGQGVHCPTAQDLQETSLGKESHNPVQAASEVVHS